MDFEKEFAEAKTLAERRLGEFFPGGGLQEAMRYSLLAGGKRIRPILAMKFCEAAGGTMEEALDFGCGVEMLHTYSLIHDDLPCMDNDDLRRGKPTNHKVYGETLAVLAGDALQPAAYELILERVPGTRERLACALLLAEASGPDGMVAGQVLDTLHHPSTEAELAEVHRLKTGCMIRAACVMGCAAADASAEMREAACTYAEKLGLAFQIRDDMLDVMGDQAEFGKPIGSDAEQGKCTYVGILGLEECERRVLSLTEEAKAALEKVEWHGSTAFLRMLADSLAVRTH